MPIGLNLNFENASLTIVLNWVSVKKLEALYRCEFSIKEYISLILGVLIDFRVIITVVVMLMVVSFAKFVTTYKKRPPRPKKKKEKTAPAPAPKSEEKKEGEASGDAGEAK